VLPRKWPAIDGANLVCLRRVCGANPCSSCTTSARADPVSGGTATESSCGYASSGLNCDMDRRSPRRLRSEQPSGLVQSLSIDIRDSPQAPFDLL
jgi:hypothetical protein